MSALVWVLKLRVGGSSKPPNQNLRTLSTPHQEWS